MPQLISTAKYVATEPANEIGSPNPSNPFQAVNTSLIESPKT